MGVCMSKAKGLVDTIDKKHVEMSVKARKVSISERALTLANEYTRRIAGGETVVLKPEEFLPKSDLAGLETNLTAESTMPQRLKSALYVASNQIFRNTMKNEIWSELKPGLEARKLPAPIVQHSQIASDQAVEMALNKQIELMAQAIEKGEAMVSEEEKKAVAEWQAAKAKEKEAAAVAPADKKSESFDKLNNKGAVSEKEKELAGEERRGGLSGGHERNTEIAAI
jgi:hypothetical protein